MDNQTPDSNLGQQTINIQVPSTNNIASRRPLIPASFALAIILFFFTFCDFKCGGQKIGSVTGLELVTGSELKGHDMMSGRETKGEKIPSSIWAILAFGAAVIGLGTFLIKEKREALIGTGAGAIGFGSLLILQFVIKNAIEEKGKGQIETDFQFPYWGALIALGVASIISYLRLQKTHNIVVSTILPSTAIPITENISQPQATFTSIPHTSNFDIGKWLNKNKKILIGIFTSLIVLYGIYYFLLRHDPVKDAKNVAAAYCDCSTKNNDAMIEAETGFLKSFDSCGFKKRQEARNKLQELQNSVSNNNLKCTSEAQQKYNDLRNQYVTEEEMLSKFDFAYNAQSGICNPSNQSKLTSIYSDIENKIASIKDPEPDIEKIKSDLVGQKILGWNFDYISEIRTATISNTTRSSDRIEYKIDMHLVGYTKTEDSYNDAQVIVTYMQGNDGWHFGEVKEIYITYIYKIPVNQWTSLNFNSFPNCSYTIIHNDQKFWVQDGSYGTQYKGGPDGDQYHLGSSEIYLMSREDHPIDLIFKYTPNN